MPVDCQVQEITERQAAGSIVICGRSLLMEIVTAGLTEEAAMPVIRVEAMPGEALAQITALKPKAVIIESCEHDGALARTLLSLGISLITLDPEESMATVVEEKPAPVTSMLQMAQMIQRLGNH